MKKLLPIILLAAGMQQAMAQAQRNVLVEEFSGTWCGSPAHAGKQSVF